MNRPSSLFDRYIGRSRPLWARIGFSLTLILLPFVAAFLDGKLASFFNQGMGVWRFFLQAPAIILYILWIAPIMHRNDANVIQSLRSVVRVDDDEYQDLVRRMSHVHPIIEVVAFICGVIFGMVNILLADIGTLTPWFTFSWILTTCLMHGLIIWTIAVVIASTRLTRALHRQELCIDIFDTSPFEPIGRQSLAQALVFIGGITLSLLFILTPQNIRQPELWLSVGFIGLAPILAFFLNMLPTNRVLSAEKKRELGNVQQHILKACRSVIQYLDADKAIENLATEITALVVYEQRLQAARTWPYNLAMLRTLFFSILVPGITMLLRLLLDAR